MIIISLKSKLFEVLRDEDGATAIEYGLIAATMAVALIPGLASLSNGASSLYGIISNLFQSPILFH